MGGRFARRAVYPRRVRAGKKMNGDEELEEGPAASRWPLSRKETRSDRKAFAAAALAFHVRIAEAERLVQTLLHEIDLGAIDEAKTVAIYDDLDALILEHDVLSFDVVGVVHDVRKSRAAGLFHTEAQAQAVTPASEEITDTISSSVGQ